MQHEVTTKPYLIGNSSYVCQYKEEYIAVNSRGLFLGDNPMYYSTPLLLAQLTIITLTTYATNYCLRPLRQTSVASQILAGIFLGPSLLGHFKVFTDRIFPRGSHSTLETIAAFGVMFFIFQLSVKVDPNIIKQCGRMSVTIGVLAFSVPLVFSVSLALVLKRLVNMDGSLADTLPLIAGSQSLTGFVVIASHLTELKMINTDLGRLAISSSLVGDLIGMSFTACFLALQQFHTDPLDALLGIITSLWMVGFIVFIIRPMALWMIRQIPVGEPANEMHICALFVSVLVIGFMSETIGQHFILGPIILGLALPDGPPLGAEVVEKLDSFVSFVLFPTYLAVSGLKTDMNTIDMKSLLIVTGVVVFACMVKVVVIMLPCLYCNMPSKDAFVLGLTLNVKGIVELLLYNIWKDIKLLRDQEFSLTVFSVLLLTMVISPLMRGLYNPSKKFVSSKRNTIQHAKRNAELRFLVCINKQENVPSIINILEISHPTAETPLYIIVLQLVELVGRSAPLLVAHQPEHNFMCGGTRTQTIVNAFRQYETLNQGSTHVQPFTAVAHFSTMHDDICNVAIDKKVNFVITPFHKEWAIDGRVGSENRAIRTMNKNILEKAPCSVGIFIDRNILSGSLTAITSRSFYRVAVIFMGGADDGEALAYSARMAEHPQVTLTVIRFLAFGCDNARERKVDNDTMDEFKHSTAHNKDIYYKEEVVRDGEGLAASIRDMGGNYDLVLVGRQHKNDNRLLNGLNEWNECPELGIIGDMLASSDFRGHCSVLVVQQARIRPGMRNRDLLASEAQNDEHGVVNDGLWRISVESEKRRLDLDIDIDGDRNEDWFLDTELAKGF